MVFSGDGDHEILGMVDDGPFGKFILNICKRNYKKSMCNFQASLISVLCKFVYKIYHIFLFYFIYTLIIISTHHHITIAQPRLR